jgi:Holliday junction resolvase-like predicted endonuclease
MHTKLKGNIAEASTVLALMSCGCKVFRELGDLSRIDLIADFNGKIYTIQVKGITPKNGVLNINLVKSGPNYKYRYGIGDCDLFAICNLETKEVALVPLKTLLINRKQVMLRITETKNNQKCGIRSILRNYK